MLAQRLSRDWIAGHIPHAGAMCLLDGVLEWDAQRIVCAAESHRRPDNPLRVRDRLPAACGIEYAAQAMAVHGALIAGATAGRPRTGYLVSVRGASLNVAWLDDIAAALRIEAERLGGEGGGALYAFALSTDARELVSGRAAVLLDAGELGAPAP